MRRHKVAEIPMLVNGSFNGYWDNMYTGVGFAGCTYCNYNETGIVIYAHRYMSRIHDVLEYCIH